VMHLRILLRGTNIVERQRARFGSRWGIVCGQRSVPETAWERR
jgi:hypothetical protein